MNSPFFWKNLSLVLLLIVNFVFIVWLIARPPVPESLPLPVMMGIALRAISVMYATLSLMLMIFVVMEFLDDEFSPRAQACWQRRFDWKRIKPGMTKKQAMDILGTDCNRSIWNDLDRSDYKLHPLDLFDSGNLYCSIVPENGTEEAKVVEKYPPDERLVYFDTYWLPNFFTSQYVTLRDRFVGAMMAISFVGILLLAFLSSLPVWPVSNWHSFSLYLPAAALVFCIVNEKLQSGGWRCDAIFLIPAYGIILCAWLLRVIHVARME